MNEDVRIWLKLEKKNKRTTIFSAISRHWTLKSTKRSRNIFIFQVCRWTQSCEEGYFSAEVNVCILLMASSGTRLRNRADKTWIGIRNLFTILPSLKTRKKNETQRSTLFVSAKLLVANARLTSECIDQFVENLEHDSYSRIEKYQKTEWVRAANEWVFWYHEVNCKFSINTLLSFSFRVSFGK